MPPDRYKRESEVDERFIDEWIEFGWSELVSYLTKYAKFDAWCLEHGRKEEPAT